MKWVSFIFYSIGLVGICFAGNEAKQTVLWERKLPFYRLYYSVNKSDTVAYFTTNGNIVEALDLKTGKPLWIVTYSETVSTEFRRPLIDGKTLFFGNQYGCYYSLDIASRKKNFSILWDRRGPSPYCECPYGGVSFDSTIVISGLFNGGGRIQCLLKRTGKVLWEKHYDKIDLLAPVHSDGVSIFAIIGNSLTCLDRNGNVKWEYRGGDANFSNFEMNFLKDKIVYCSENAIQVLALQSGKPLWKKEGFSFGSKIPLIWENSIIAGTSYDRITLFDLQTGVEKWAYKIPVGGMTARKPIKMGVNVCCAMREYDSTILYWLNGEHGTVQYRSILERKGDVMQTNDLGNNEVLAWSLKSDHPDSLAYSILRRIRFSF